MCLNSDFTDYDQWSTRQFVVSYDDFIKITNGNVVKMKVSKIDTYQVSSFGKGVNGAIVNGKFAPFITQINLLRR